MVLVAEHNKNRLLLSGAVLALLAFGAGGYVLTHASQAGTPDSTQGQQPQAMPVQVMLAQHEPVQIWKEFSARMVAVDYAAIRPQVSGTISEIRFRDGQDVQQGDVLFVIDPRPYEAAVAQAEAELAAAENDAHHAARELERSKSLIAKKAIAQSLYDSRENAARVAKAAVKAAQAKLEQAQINKDYAYVKAPISGRVSRAEITEGNLVEAGVNAPVLTSIVSKGGIYADFEIDETTYMSNMRVHGAPAAAEQTIPVKLLVGDNDDAPIDGFIRSFDNRIDPASGTIRARAYFLNEGGQLLPGMFARIQVGSAHSDDAILVPERAIGTNQNKKFVYVVDADNTVVYREVSLGESLQGRRIIVSGLSDGDKIITDGVIRIRPGMAVSPQIGAASGAEAQSQG